MLSGGQPDKPRNVPAAIDALVTTDAMVALHDATRQRLGAVTEITAPLATRRPENPVPPDTLALARLVLADVVRVTSCIGGPRLIPIRGAVTNSGLQVRLTLADSALDLFRERYAEWNRDTLSYIWKTRELLARGPDLSPSSEAALY